MAYRQNIISNMTTRIGILFLAFIGSILTARALGPEQKGVLAYAWNIFIILASFGHFGINNVVIYFNKQKHFSYLRLINTNSIFLFALSLMYGGLFFFLKTSGVIFTQYTTGFLFFWICLYFF